MAAPTYVVVVDTPGPSAATVALRVQTREPLAAKLAVETMLGEGWEIVDSYRED